MTRRMFDSRLWANYRFGQMPLMARMLLLGIINHADDQGRMMAKPIYLRTEIFRYDTDITDDKVAECLKLIESNGTIELYEADDKEYLQLKNWWDYQSLQFAAPSNMPRPKEWTDRVRYNAKGGNTLTCNWLTPQGKKLDDTCDQDGNALPVVATLPPRNPGGRPPQNQPEKPPVNGHENPGGNPQANPNKDQYKININHDQDQGGEYARTHDQPAPLDPPPVKLHARNGASSERFYRSPHIDKTHFDPLTGFVPPGRGTTAVEVYYERFDICHNDERLTSPMEDDLMLNCSDLERLRDAITAYSRAGYKTMRNIKLILDWYKEPERYQGKPSMAVLSGGNGRSSPVDKTQAAADQLRAMLISQGKDGVLHG